MPDETNLPATFLLGKNVRKYRKLRNLTQKDLAAKINNKETYVSFIEKGECNCTINKIEAIAQALDIPYEYLFKDDEPPIESLKASTYDIRKVLSVNVRSQLKWANLTKSELISQINSISIDKQITMRFLNNLYSEDRSFNCTLASLVPLAEALDSDFWQLFDSSSEWFQQQIAEEAFDNLMGYNNIENDVSNKQSLSYENINKIRNRTWKKLQTQGITEVNPSVFNLIVDTIISELENLDTTEYE